MGKFASEIYEKNGMTFEAALLSYLDFEYRSGFEDLQESQILSKIEKFEALESALLRFSPTTIRRSWKSPRMYKGQAEKGKAAENKIRLLAI